MQQLDSTVADCRRQSEGYAKTSFLLWEGVSRLKVTMALHRMTGNLHMMRMSAVTFIHQVCFEHCCKADLALILPVQVTAHLNDGNLATIHVKSTLCVVPLLL